MMPSQNTEDSTHEFVADAVHVSSLAGASLIETNIDQHGRDWSNESQRSSRTRICAVALTAACNNNRTANREAGTTGTAGAGVSNSDKNFVSDQLSDGMAEIELAKVAKDHAASSDVKQFAQMMIDDHTKAGDQRKPIMRIGRRVDPADRQTRSRSCAVRGEGALYAVLPGNQIDRTVSSRWSSPAALSSV
jgi:uncharacterized protein (DUF305 family)